MANEKCRVYGCSSIADYKVETIWFGPYPEEVERHEMDEHCPYICHEHMLQNEESRVQDNMYIHWFKYSYTKPDDRRGWSTYLPLDSNHTLLYQPPEKLIISGQSVSPELLSALQIQPELLRQLRPRQFEEVVAEILNKHGFEIELTPETRDGGVDIIATRNDPLGKILYIVECKRYTPPKKVGIDIVQRIFGVSQSFGANIPFPTCTILTRLVDIFIPPPKTNYKTYYIHHKQ